MSTVVFDSVLSAVAARAVARNPAQPEAKPTRKGFWARAYDRMIEARMRRAEEQICQLRHW